MSENDLEGKEFHLGVKNNQSTDKRTRMRIKKTINKSLNCVIVQRVPYKPSEDRRSCASSRTRVVHLSMK